MLLADSPVLQGNGRFDAIHVGASLQEVPRAFVQLLRPGGRLVLPLGAMHGAAAQVSRGWWLQLQPVAHLLTAACDCCKRRCFHSCCHTRPGVIRQVRSAGTWHSCHPNHNIQLQCIDTPYSLLLCSSQCVTGEPRLTQRVSGDRMTRCQLRSAIRLA